MDFTQMVGISERLKDERKRLGLTQTDLATVGGVQISAQSNYEKGSRKPDSDYLQAVAAHGVDVLYVLTGTRQSMSELPVDLATLVRAYEYSDEASRATLHSVALMALRATDSKAPYDERPAGNVVSVAGDVGQQVNGDQTVTAPMTFTVGGRSKSK